MTANAGGMASKGERAIVLSSYTKVEAGYNLTHTTETLIGYTALVCALHEQRAPVSKVWKKIKNTNKLLKGIKRRVNFSRGCKSLMHRINVLKH